MPNPEFFEVTDGPGKVPEANRKFHIDCGEITLSFSPRGSFVTESGCIEFVGRTNFETKPDALLVLFPDLKTGFLAYDWKEAIDGSPS